MVIAIDAESRLTGLTSVTVSNRDPGSQHANDQAAGVYARAEQVWGEAVTKRVGIEPAYPSLSMMEWLAARIRACDENDWNCELLGAPACLQVTHQATAVFTTTSHCQIGACFW